MDLIFVTFNSEKWIDQCFISLLESDFELKDLNIIVIDNHSTVLSLEYLKKYKKKFSICKSYIILEESVNHGFGKANNIAAQYGNSEIIVFVNIDIEFYQDTLQILNKEIDKSSNDIGIWEMRQFPYEHPKKYDVVTMETSWASGAAFAIRRCIYEQVGGFDEIFFMYAEDVDLSWRVRGSGYKIKYVPRAAIKHYTYTDIQEIKPLQYCNSIINDLYLRYRYGSLKQIIMGNCRVIKHILQKPLYKGARGNLFEKYIKHFSIIKSCKLKVQCSKEAAKFIRFNYEHHRIGAFYYHEKLTNEPELTVIVINEALKDVDKLLQCLENQTYSHIKWYYSGKSLEFRDKEMVYMNLETRISDLSTPYFSLIDENFLYFADHFETLINFLENNNHLGATSYCSESNFQKDISGTVFSTDKMKVFDQDICLADVYGVKYESVISQKIICIDVETRETWRH